MFSALQCASAPVTDIENSAQIDAIIGVAILPETDTKLTEKRGSKFGALLLRLKKDLGKFTSCRAFGAHKLDHSELFFFDYFYEL